MPTSSSLAVSVQTRAGGEPEPLVAGGGRTRTVPGSQLCPLVPTQAVGQEMGSFVCFGVDKALGKDKS